MKRKNDLSADIESYSNTHELNVGLVTGGVRKILRIESFAVFGASVFAYFYLGGDILMFIILFFSPDVTLTAYVFGPQIGSVAYNFTHSYLPPIVLGSIGILIRDELCWMIALILISHSTFDRSLGFGLKYASGFSFTHMGNLRK